MSSTRARYQAGSLEKRKTAQGPCWYIRFRVPKEGGGSSRPWHRIGLVSELPSKRAAMQAADALRRDFNASAQLLVKPRTFNELIDRYMREEMPPRHSTAKGYRGKIENHIRPKWGKTLISDVRPMIVRDWLESLPMAPKTRGHIRDLMRSLFRFAMFWEWIPAGPNPMSLFQLKQSSKRTRKIVVLTPEEFRRVLEHPLLRDEPYTTMVKLAASLGVSCSELFGLRWNDIDWMSGVLKVGRSIVDGHVDDVKTEARSKPIPLNPTVLSLLVAHRSRAKFRDEDDWVFASPMTGGEKPYHAQHIQTKRIAPVMRAMGFPAGTGWHTFRHSYRALLDDAGTPLGIMRDLLRHADIKTTMNVYGGSYIDSLRTANGHVVSELFGTSGANGLDVAQGAKKC